MNLHKNRTALLIGGTGLVGAYCLDFLLEEPAYESVVMLTRRHIDKQHSKLKIEIVDFDNIDAYSDLIKADDVYCAIGTTFLKSPRKEDYFKIDYIYPEKIANIALQNGAQRFTLVSALSASPNALLFYSRVKGKLEAAVSKLGFSGVYIFRPSYLLGKRKEFRPIEMIGRIILSILKPFLIGKLKPIRAIEARSVAKAMVLKTLEGKAGVYIFSSDQIQAMF